MIFIKVRISVVLLLIFAFLAGLVTIFSPCILSIAPILLAAGSNGNHKKPLGIITGLIISFSFFTLTLSAITKATGVSPDIFRYIALGIVILFGLTMIIPAFERAFDALTQRIAQAGSIVEKFSFNIHTNFISGFILGIALGLLWTPCAGPILATIATLAATGQTTLLTILITLAYATGAAIPMLLFCFSGAKMINSMTSLAPYTHIIRQIFGIIVIATAVAMMLHVDIIIQEKVAHWFPSITLEQNKFLEKELNTLRTSQGVDSMAHAPEIVGISHWLNSEPLTLAQLKGKVVLLDFWTYSCINCVRTLPHVKEWYKEYKDHGFEIIGIHTPEFAFEKSVNNVENAVKKFGITYPVALDNDYQTWQAYGNHYWPAHYLIDQSGLIIKKHFGEGEYTEMENAIRGLLGIPPCGEKEECATAQPSTTEMPETPETYLGFARATQYQPSVAVQRNVSASYRIAQNLGSNQVGLEGTWTIMSDHTRSDNDKNSLQLNFIANQVYLVMQSDTPKLISVLLDGKPVEKKYWTSDMDAQGKIVVHEPRMYNILDLKDNYGRHLLTLECPAEVKLYVFTFGASSSAKAMADATADKL